MFDFRVFFTYHFFMSITKTHSIRPIAITTAQGVRHVVIVEGG